MKQKQKIAYIKSNVWGNYYVLVSGRKIKDWKGKQSNKPDILDYIAINYPDHEIKDQTKY